MTNRAANFSTDKGYLSFRDVWGAAHLVIARDVTEVRMSDAKSTWTWILGKRFSHCVPATVEEAWAAIIAANLS